MTPPRGIRASMPGSRPAPGCPTPSPKAMPTPAWWRRTPTRPRKPKMRPDRTAAALLALALSATAATAAAQSLPPGLLEKAQALPAPTHVKLPRHHDALDRTRVGEGKRWSVSLHLGGTRIIKKTIQIQ